MSFEKDPCAGLMPQGGISRSATTVRIDFAQGRASSYVMSDIGATSPGRWQSTQRAAKIGATSAENVTLRAGALSSAWAEGTNSHAIDRASMAIKPFAGMRLCISTSPFHSIRSKRRGPIRGVALYEFQFMNHCSPMPGCQFESPDKAPTGREGKAGSPSLPRREQVTDLALVRNPAGIIERTGPRFKHGAWLHITEVREPRRSSFYTGNFWNQMPANSLTGTSRRSFAERSAAWHRATAHRPSAPVASSTSAPRAPSAIRSIWVRSS